MSDMMTRMRADISGIRERLREDAREMAQERRVLGPRTRRRLRDNIMSLPAEEAAATVLKLQEKGRHKDGEKIACPACRFLDGE